MLENADVQNKSIDRRKRSRLVLDMDQEVIRKVKVAAAMRGTSPSVVFTKALEVYLSDDE